MIEHPNCELDPDVYSAALDPLLSSVAVARLMLRAALWDWQLDHMADTAQLVLSELAANAVKFATRVEVIVYLRDDNGAGMLAIEVIDDNPQPPQIVDADLDDESHRGMVLVDALASKWGVDLMDAGKVTWAHLEYDEDSLPTRTPQRPTTVPIVPPISEAGGGLEGKRSALAGGVAEPEQGT